MKGLRVWFRCGALGLDAAVFMACLMYGAARIPCPKLNNLGHGGKDKDCDRAAPISVKDLGRVYP